MQITRNLLSSNVVNDLGESRQPTKGSPRHVRVQDQVQISSQASLHSLKLTRLQESYDGGTYNVSPSQIANSIINAMLPS